MPETKSQVNLDKKEKKGWRARISGSPTLLFSLLLHILFAVLAGYYIVSRTQEKRKATFSEVSVTPVTPQLERKVQMTKMQNAQSAPEVTQRIVTKELSTVSLPDVPMPTDTAGEGSAKMGSAVIGGSGVGPGTAGGGSPISIDVSMVATAFGLADGKGLGLVGHFYDLKQTKERTPLTVTDSEYYKILQDYAASGWRKEDLRKYFVAPKPIYAPRLFTAYIPSVQAPQAFGVEKFVQPRYWMIHYQGKFTVPHSGTFRFVGYADNIMEISVNHHIVFDYISHKATPLPNLPHTKDYSYHFPKMEGKMSSDWTFYAGSWMSLNEGEPTDIDILIGDDGGFCGYSLLVEEQNVTYKMTDQGSPILPLFRVSNVKLPDIVDKAPPSDPTDLGWTLIDDPEAEAEASPSSDATSSDPNSK